MLCHSGRLLLPRPQGPGAPVHLVESHPWPVLSPHTFCSPKWPWPQSHPAGLGKKKYRKDQEEGSLKEVGQGVPLLRVKLLL